MRKWRSKRTRKKRTKSGRRQGGSESERMIVNKMSGY